MPPFYSYEKLVQISSVATLEVVYFLWKKILEKTPRMFLRTIGNNRNQPWKRLSDVRFAVTNLE